MPCGFQRGPYNLFSKLNRIIGLKKFLTLEMEKTKERYRKARWLLHYETEESGDNMYISWLSIPPQDLLPMHCMLADNELLCWIGMLVAIYFVRYKQMLLVWLPEIHLLLHFSSIMVDWFDSHLKIGTKLQGKGRLDWLFMYKDPL